MLTAHEETILNTVQSVLALTESAAGSPYTADDRDAPADKRTVTKLSVLIPVYNERWTIEEIIHRVLHSPVSVELELIVVDDRSTDGSWEVVETMAKLEPRIRAFRHERNQGKGAAIRTAIGHMTGDVAIIQDADLEYDPREYLRLLGPILAGKADAVFGSRFAGTPRRVLMFWHGLANHVLTTLSNMINDLNLTDMETCYKMVRADVLRQLNLKSNTFTLEPEITCRLAQWGARIYEVPISYSGRTFQEGKKIRPIDGLKALGEMIRCKFWDTRFTTHSGMYVLKSVAKATRYNRWLLGQCREFLGRRVLEAGAGIGNLSSLLLDRERLVLVDYEDTYVARLQERFGQRRNIRAVQADLTDPSNYEQFSDESLDTIFCSNVLEHLEPDEQVLGSFHETLAPGGHCVIVVPADPRLFTGVDEELGHFRRYTADELRAKMHQAGFDVVHEQQFCKLGAIAWWLNGKLGRRHLSPSQMRTFDRLWPVAKHLDRCLPAVPGMSLMMVGRKAC